MKALYDKFLNIFKRNPNLIFYTLFYFIILVSFITLIYYSQFRSLENTIIQYKNKPIELKKALEKCKSDYQILKVSTGIFPHVFKNYTFNEDWTKYEDVKEDILRLNKYGKEALNKDDYQYAKSKFNESIQIKPTFEALYLLGLSEYLSNNKEEAIKYWLDFIKMDKTKLYPDIYFYITLAYYELGDTKNAKENMRLYLNVDKEINDKLDELLKNYGMSLLLSEEFISKIWVKAINSGNIKSYADILDKDFQATFSQINRPKKFYNKQEWIGNQQFFLRKGLHVELIDLHKTSSYGKRVILQSEVIWNSKHYCMKVPIEFELVWIEGNWKITREDMSDSENCQIKTMSSFLTHVDALAGAKKESNWKWIWDQVASKDTTKTVFSIIEYGDYKNYPNIMKIPKKFPGLDKFDINRRTPWIWKDKGVEYEYRIEMQAKYSYFHIIISEKDKQKELQIYKFEYFNKKWYFVQLDIQLQKI